MRVDARTIPDALKEGEQWELLNLDYDWVWFARSRDGDIVGMLIAAPCHGLAFIMRVKLLPTAPNWALGRLFRTFLRDIARRGYFGYFTMLDVTQEKEMALVRIAYRAGAMFTTATTIAYGSVNAKHGGV